MAKECGRNFNVNFNFCNKSIILFMSKIVKYKLSTFRNISFRKLEKDLKCFIKLDVDTQYLKFLKQKKIINKSQKIALIQPHKR